MVNIDNFKKAGFSLEEISVIDQNLKDFDTNGVSSDLDESFKMLNTSIFSKYAVQNV